jgi:hypothetical protein
MFELAQHVNGTRENNLNRSDSCAAFEPERKGRHYTDLVFGGSLLIFLIFIFPVETRRGPQKNMLSGIGHPPPTPQLTTL